MSKQTRVRKLLEQGLQFHRAGDLATAEKNYIGAAEADPRNADASNLRGVVALSTGRLPLAVTLFRKATSLQPTNPGFWGNLGNALFEANDHTDSEAAYRRASRLDTANPEFSTGIANALAAAGKVDDAGAIFLHVVERRPGHAAAWFGLAKLAQTAGDTERALQLYQRTLQADPNYGNAHLNTGVLLQSLNRMDESEQCYRQAMRCGGPRETAFINLASVLTAQGNFEEAVQIARAGIAEFPRNADMHRLLSAAYLQQGNLSAARAPAKQAAELDPGNVALQLSLGGILFETGFPEQGLAALENIRLTHPADAQVAHGVGITHLTAGNFREGWQHFLHRELRRTKIETRPWLDNALPPELHGTLIRLYREQGLGDELFFLRYAPILKTLGARVLYITDPKLSLMLERTACFDQVTEELSDRQQDHPPDASDNAIQLLVGDLPHELYRGFGEHCRTLPPPLALSALPEQITAAREKLLRFGPPPYLALTWRGGIAPHDQKGKWWALFKNIGLEAFGKTLNGLPYTLLAVQRNPFSDEIAQLTLAAGAPIHDLCHINDDLEAMLGLLAVVDEYVGVSNTNMHLRAGLQRSARVLVPRPSEWRWMAYGEQSPWFPQFTVYRQGIDGTWQEALDRLRAELR